MCNCREYEWHLTKDFLITFLDFFTFGKFKFFMKFFVFVVLPIICASAIGFLPLPISLISGEILVSKKGEDACYYPAEKKLNISNHGIISLDPLMVAFFNFPKEAIKYRACIKDADNTSPEASKLIEQIRIRGDNEIILSRITLNENDVLDDKCSEYFEISNVDKLWFDIPYRNLCDVEPSANNMTDRRNIDFVLQFELQYRFLISTFSLFIFTSMFWAWGLLGLSALKNLRS